MGLVFAARIQSYLFTNADMDYVRLISNKMSRKNKQSVRFTYSCLANKEIQHIVVSHLINPCITSME